jgi:endonuclease-3 related protein
MTLRARLERILARLDAAYDYAGWHWQPDTPPDYVCISAVLVQHTNWANVERALERLAAAGARSLAAIASLPQDRLADLVRPAGTPTVKARRLRALARLAAWRGGLDRLLALPPGELRPLLLATDGIGPETADAILLNAAGRPVFEVDAYTTRVFRRLGLGPDGDSYHHWQQWFESALPPDVETYRRYHGLLVLHGKRTCRPKPRCAACCLLELCPTGRGAVATEVQLHAPPGEAPTSAGPAPTSAGEAATTSAGQAST